MKIRVEMASTTQIITTQIMLALSMTILPPTFREAHKINLKGSKKKTKRGGRRLL